MKNFTNLSDNEYNLAGKFVARKGGNTLTNAIVKNSDVKVAYKQDGNFYQAIVKTSKKIYVGVAKRNPNDKVNPQVGFNVAFTRALGSEPLSV